MIKVRSMLNNKLYYLVDPRGAVLLGSDGRFTTGSLGDLVVEEDLDDLRQGEFEEDLLGETVPEEEI